MIKRWNEFIREFIENSESLVDAKMQELKDLIESVSDGNNIIYEWQNKNDHELVVSFSTDSLSIRYDFDIDELYITKTAGQNIDFETSVESIDEALEIIEKDIHSILGISESYHGEWESSIKYSDAEEVYDNLTKIEKIDIYNNTADFEGLVDEMESTLQFFDKETIETVIDISLFNPDADKDWIIEEIIRTGDKIMNKYGTEPRQVLNAFDMVFRRLKRHFDWPDEEDVNERTKAQRYKGRKIPGKYLTANPGKMKKEIDRFVGKKEYKKDWDADYKSGKGGQGKRVKTKKSAATKAYQRMFGNKEK